MRIRKSTILRFVGLALALFGIIVATLVWQSQSVTTYNYVNGTWSESTAYYPDYAQVLQVIVFYTLPGILLFAGGTILRKREDNLIHLSSLLKTYRKVEISDIARKMNKGETETIKLIEKCLKKKYVSGKFDSTLGNFLTLKATSEQIESFSCPFCNTSFPEKVLTGETRKCPYCGNMVAVPSSSKIKPNLNNRKEHTIKK